MSGNKATHISVRKVSKRHVPSHASPNHAADIVIGDVLATAGISEDDPRIEEFRAVAKIAGILTTGQLLDLDTVGVTITGEEGSRQLIAVRPPAPRSNPVDWRP